MSLYKFLHNVLLLSNIFYTFFVRFNDVNSFSVTGESMLDFLLELVNM